MDFTKFCPMCGKETERLYGDKKKLCAECYPKKNQLLDIPPKTHIKICSVCGRMRKSGEWLEKYSLQDQLLEKFTDFAEEGIEMELQFWEDEELNVRVHAYKGEHDEIHAHYDTIVEIEQEQCKDCSRFEGGFFKVKIQLRGDENKLEKVSKEMVDKAAEATNETRKDFLSNIDEKEHGYDFFLSTERITKKILSEIRANYNPEIKRSYELIGEEDGQEVYRNVVSVRIN